MSTKRPNFITGWREIEAPAAPPSSAEDFGFASELSAATGVNHFRVAHLRIPPGLRGYPPMAMDDLEIFSFVLEGVVSQTLLPKATGGGRVIALEVMVPNPAIRNLIREDKIHQIYSQMQIGQDKFGMQTLNQSLADLYGRRLITLEDAQARSSDPDELSNLIANPNTNLTGRRRSQAS